MVAVLVGVRKVLLKVPRENLQRTLISYHQVFSQISVVTIVSCFKLNPKEVKKPKCKKLPKIVPTLPPVQKLP